MRRALFYAAVAAALFTAGAAYPETIVWPMFGRDARHTGLSGYAGPASPVLNWSYAAGGLIQSSPVIGSDGTIYFGSGYSPSNRFYALNSNGTFRWSYRPICAASSSPAVSGDTVYVHAQDDPFFYAFNSAGAIGWSYNTGMPIGQSSPTIGSDGTLYFGSYDSRLYAVNSNGALKWSYRTGNSVYSSPAIGSDGTIYFGSNDNKLYAVRSSGIFRWSYTTGAPVQSSPAIGSDGTIYWGSNDNALYAVQSNGGFKWTYLTGGAGTHTSPSIGSDGTIYFGSNDNKLYAFNPSSGAVRWSYTTGNKVQSSPAIGSDGTIYWGSNDNALYAVQSNGTLKWTYPTGGKVESSPAIGSDGTIYFGTYGGQLYSLGIPGTPIPTPTPAIGQLIANGSVLKRGERLIVDFKLNQAITRKFDVWSAIVFPDGHMIDTEDFLPGPAPLALDVPGLNPPFEYNLLNVVIPPGTPPGEYEIVVCFFDSDSDYHAREDAFFQASVKVTVQ